MAASKNCCKAFHNEQFIRWRGPHASSFELSQNEWCWIFRFYDKRRIYI